MLLIEWILNIALLLFFAVLIVGNVIRLIIWIGCFRKYGYPFYSAKHSLQSVGFDFLGHINEPVRHQRRISTVRQTYFRFVTRMYVRN